MYLHICNIQKKQLDGLWCLTPLSTIFYDISIIQSVAVSFIGGGNQSTQKKPLTCHKSLTLYHIMLHQVHLPMNRVGTHNVSIDQQVVVNQLEQF